MGEAKPSEQKVEDKKPDPISFAEFLQGVPASTWRDISDVWEEATSSSVSLNKPDLLLYCATKEICERNSVFRSLDGAIYLPIDGSKSVFMNYKCSNCQQSFKRFALQITTSEDADEGHGRCYKFGELPQYGFATPARLQRLFQSDRELFLKGRQCEIHSLGIGAFVYYRRVVENHKNDIFDSIIKVAQTLGAPAEMITTLNAAKAENQFSRAMESVKDAIPDVLYIDGANPITLLHSALSLGLHAQSDAQCLAFAHDVRLVLIELSERLSQVLKDDAELSGAVKRLMDLRKQSES